MSDARSPAEVVAQSSAIASIVARERDDGANSRAVASCEPSKSLVSGPQLWQSAPRVPGFAGAIAANLRRQHPKPSLQGKEQA
jgi:hypothetical protein